ncbi:MAG: nucleotidyltransferase family protein [Zoogloeaceae bacterium]|jgi:MurNAc alpha-1-phosphate uridylyltransferase|nr:nucleotidyltransferase family protein [Zoogloeaceae bacterium]
MRVMILAAGRGERMRPLSDVTPKALLPAGGKPLIVWHLERLAAAGFRHVIVNVAHLGDQIERALGNGAAWGLHILYSHEPPGALETAGGVAHVLPLLGDHPFLLINADVFCDWDPETAAKIPMRGRLAHLLLVDNPPHHPEGDFALVTGKHLTLAEEGRLTYAGIGVYSPRFFTGLDPDRPAPLAPLLRQRILEGAVSGERYAGKWADVGTPERLRDLDTQLAREAQERAATEEKTP